jgi:hypothetical protein
MKRIETDRESGAEVFRLTDDPRPTDNIYGEQPYNSPEGNRVAIRHYPADGREGGLSILDLNDGAVEPVIETTPRFPAFHAWGEYFYYQEEERGRLFLKRRAYRGGKSETIAGLPTERGRFSYGTVSQDGRLYAVSVHRPDGSCEVFCVDLLSQEGRMLAETREHHFKHEQFSRDGANRVLIQANRMPDVRQVLLGTLEPAGEGVAWLAADRPHTPRPTGHEAWVGTASRVFFSTAFDEAGEGNLWVAGVGEQSPRLACVSPSRFGHVSVSRCGRYWIADAPDEDGIPIYAGSFASARWRRLVFSRTVHDGEQWSHTHPYLTADSRWLVYTSTRCGTPQVYGARIASELFASL